MPRPFPRDPDAAATLAAETLASLLPYFPSTSEIAIEQLANELIEMCPHVEAIEYVMRRALALWDKWESVKELRAILCSKYKPKDGIEAITKLFAEGIVPSEIPQYSTPALPPAPLEATPKQIEARRKAAVVGLPDGAIASADPEADQIIRRLIPKTSPPEVVRRRLAAIERRRPPKTEQFDLKKAEQELREILAEQARNRREREAEEKAKAEGGDE